MSLKILKAGVADSIQNSGRYGWQYLGINPGGAMDHYAMTLANILVCNDDHEAVIEMHFPASVFLFQQASVIALAGTGFSANLNGEYIPLYQPVFVSKNSVLLFEEPGQGTRTYLAVKGGFDIPSWLNSYSTNIKAGAGGFMGRVLQKNDELPLKQTIHLPEKIMQQEKFVFPWRADPDWGDAAKDEIFVIPGNEWEWLTNASQQDFENNEFIITPHSDRMGYRLSGTVLQSHTTDELVSSAVGFGTVQLLPDGQLIVLMADHQTTGGYPRVAHVISAHHSKLAQRRPGNAIRFKLTTLQMAEALFIKQQQHLSLLREACRLRYHEFVHESSFQHIRH
jgi:antagonist of KipI